MISGIFCTEHEFQIWDRIVLQGVIKIPGQFFILFGALFITLHMFIMYCCIQYITGHKVQPVFTERTMDSNKVIFLHSKSQLIF